jgi:hypothetical protein
MGQVNVNPGGGGVVERDGTGSGMSMGLIIAIVLGLVLLAAVAWYAFTPSGWFGPAAGNPGQPQTNVNVTNNNPPAGGQTSGQTGGQTSQPAPAGR